MHETRELNVQNLQRANRVSIALYNNSLELMNAINFLSLNIDIFVHLLQKIDKYIQAFDNPKFKEFFSQNYKQVDSNLRHFLEHPGILRAYFQSKLILNKLKRKLNSVVQFERPAEKQRHSKKLNDFKIEDFNNIEESFETVPEQSQKTIQQMTEDDQLQNQNYVSEIRQRVSKIEQILDTQRTFFQNHHIEIFEFNGITIVDYYNQKELEKKAQEIYDDTNLNKDEFIEIQLRYTEEENLNQQQACYSMVDLWFVLVHTMFYLMNYYGWAATSSGYSAALNIDAGLTGIIQAITPIAATIYGFLLNYLTQSNRYKVMYLVSVTMMFIVQTYRDNKTTGLALLILGRVLFGAGGSRLMSRKFLAINVQVWAYSKYSAIFVAMSSLGMTFGPGLSSFLEFAPEGKIGNTDLVRHNILAFFFIILWGVAFILFVIFFKGHNKESDQNLKKIKYEEYLKDNGKLVPTTDPLLQDFLQRQQNKPNVISELPMVDVKKSRFTDLEQYIPNNQERKLPFLQAFFPNGMTVFSLICFLIFKMIQEAFFTELPKIAKFFYHYNSQEVGWFYLASTVYAIPVALGASYATKKYADRYIMLIGAIVYIVGTILKIDYLYDKQMPVAEFFIASIFIFSGSLISEAGAMSILAKVISPTLKRGFLNAGLLSGTLDTVGRALGNSSYTLFVSFDGQAAYLFYWYLTASILLAILILLTIYFFPKLQKYTNIRAFYLDSFHVPPEAKNIRVVD